MKHRLTHGPASPATVPSIWRHGGGPKPPTPAGRSTSSTPASTKPPPTGPRWSRCSSPMSSMGCRHSGRRGPGPMCCRRSATCNAPCRNSRDTAGRPRWSGPPTTSSPSSSTSTRPATPPAAASDGRSVWIEPTAPRFTSEGVLAQEEAILTWAMAAQADPATPSPTVDRDGLDPLQADAAASVAGDDRLVLVVGPAGAGKTRMLTTAAHDLYGERPGSCSPWRRPPRRHAPSSVTPASQPTPSPSCSTSGSEPTGHHTPTTSCRRARR